MYEILKEKYHLADDWGDWIELNNKDHKEYQKRATLIKADPGDLILWYSRTIHGGWVGTGE